MSWEGTELRNPCTEHQQRAWGNNAKCFKRRFLKEDWMNEYGLSRQVAFIVIPPYSVLHIHSNKMPFHTLFTHFSPSMVLYLLHLSCTALQYNSNKRSNINNNGLQCLHKNTGHVYQLSQGNCTKLTHSRVPGVCQHHVPKDPSLTVLNYKHR